ncbi:helix-turn-helix domain-containing protein [Bacillus thuringiensis]|uniref:helix-turn-helix domain-containing protein n=1 Tax=Bacillus thuringiensis TaxID=1428 RepID=UPI0011A6161E|nr:helix-turn-helix transcriptional regulator [Bacillus thuringiensis]
MINNFSTILGARLLTITKVHKDTGISRVTLTDLYYRRNKNISFLILKKICDYLAVPLSELIEYVPNKEKEVS